MLCGAHAQLAPAAKRFCKLSEAEYLHYFYKVLDMVVITKPCTGPNCSNLLPPFYPASLLFVCGGEYLWKSHLTDSQDISLCHTCEGAHKRSFRKQEAEAKENLGQAFIIEAPQIHVSERALPCAEKAALDCPGTAL